jgi:hypothetical protein
VASPQASVLALDAGLWKTQATAESPVDKLKGRISIHSPFLVRFPFLICHPPNAVYLRLRAKPGISFVHIALLDYAEGRHLF